MKLHLVAINEKLYTAGKNSFKEFPDVEIILGDILKVAEGCIVSPANSYGFMDGGIDRQYTEFFGLTPQQNIQERIARREEGYLPVGSAILVKTGHKKIPYMISSPTMISPGAVPASNTFYAMAAILNCYERNKQYIDKIYCPGLATGTGRVAPEIATDEMAHAYHKWLSVKCD